MTAKVRKRRPAFDREEGVAIAQNLFHERGYDAVSVADITQALDIVPPSLYAAYGSKTELFERAMKRYAETEMLPLADILKNERPPAEELSALFVLATQQYTRHDTRRGCMITEGMRADDKTARLKAAALAENANTTIRDYIAAHNPAEAERITDYVLVTLRGLSSYACLGTPAERLIECARMAGRAFEQDFPAKA
ncbi:TetR/AcrR family transcriptional regulator [uncultured Jannaschia sp.]|uniref:TetR/AcrR family transcriptional regulator n=1 Tax=uncultured Jannaschia sp. TaxID=293347 RepID=UPI00262B3222|nr:TetR/AcrR family transcriptional regulator [uncultured Jannaschia sp.]